MIVLTSELERLPNFYRVNRYKDSSERLPRNWLNFLTLSSSAVNSYISECNGFINLRIYYPLLEYLLSIELIFYEACVLVGTPSEPVVLGGRPKFDGCLVLVRCVVCLSSGKGIGILSPVVPELCRERWESWGAYDGFWTCVELFVPLVPLIFWSLYSEWRRCSSRMSGGILCSEGQERILQERGDA